MFNIANISLPGAAKPAVNGYKEYIITAVSTEAIDSLQHDLETDTSGNVLVDANIIPTRPITVANPRPGSSNQTHYWLTDAEADNIRQDARVTHLELHWDHVPALEIVNFARDYTPYLAFTRLSDFDSPSNTRNYGLHLCGNNARDYSTGTASFSDNGSFDYVLDGRNVDIIIQDSGVLVDHPEWLDPTGTYSRFQQIDWFAAAGYNQSGGANAMPANFYTSSGYHATHCAGIAAGRSFGWAKRANIYSMKILPGDDGVTNTSTHNIDPVVSFDLIKNFHLNKPLDAAGKRRPTIVSASWGYSQYFMSSPAPYDPYSGMTVYVDYQLWSKTYRSNTTATYAKDTANDGLEGTLSQTFSLNGATGYLYSQNGTVTSVDLALADMLSAGVIFVRAAGNSFHKTDESGNVDYNNYFQVITAVSPITLSSNKYYNRPGSPYADNVINVGSTYYASINGTNEYRANFSSYGSAVHVFAPGYGITSAFTNIDASYTSGYNDPYTGQATAYKLAQITGTSMACPQITGMLAQYLQINPTASQLDCKNFIQNIARDTTTLYSTGLSNDYTSSVTIGGGPQYFLRNPWGRVDRERILEGDLTVENGVITLE